MRRFDLTDRLYRFTHYVKRNRVVMIIYALCSLVFLVIGIAVGISIEDKTDYVLRNDAAVFMFLRGDAGVFKVFFFGFAMTAVYGLFALSLFFNRVVALLSVAPCLYLAFSLGMQASVIVAVFSAPAIPMLIVFYIPACIVEIAVICVLSHRCILFSMLGSRSRSKPDIYEHYRSAAPCLFVIAVCALVSALTLAMFGSALIGSL